jgi:hypothetical protein
MEHSAEDLKAAIKIESSIVWSDGFHHLNFLDDHSQSAERPRKYGIWNWDL